MAKCEVCENEYDKAFEVVVAGKHHTFDSFEFAIHVLAPVCPHCHCRGVGHGVEADGQIFCCAHCARIAGKTQLKDRAYLAQPGCAVALEELFRGAFEDDAMPADKRESSSSVCVDQQRLRRQPLGEILSA